MGESTSTIARLVKLLDEHGFDVLELSAHRRSGLGDGPSGVGLTVVDRWQAEAKDSAK